MALVAAVTLIGRDQLRRPVLAGLLRRALVRPGAPLALAGLLAAGSVGCSGGGSSAAPVTTTTASHGATTTSARHSTTSSSPASGLALLMPSTVASGFVLQADDVGDTGPSDLEKAVRDDDSPDARAVLTHAGFVRGYQRLWLAPSSDDQNILFLYEFRDAAGAAEYLGHSRIQLTDTGGGPAPVPFAVPGIPGAAGASGSDQTGSAAVIVFAKGVYVVQAVANGGAGGNQTPVALALAQAQYARL